LKARAASLGISVAEYVIRLARADGVGVEEPTGGTSDNQGN
jgi:hypothetical protein